MRLTLGTSESRKQKKSKEPIDTNEVPQFARSFKSFSLELVKVVLIALAIVVPVRFFLFEPVYVDGASMEPNFYDYEYIIVDKITYRFEEPKRGDVIVIDIPEHNGSLIKRLIGLPDEELEIAGGLVTIYNDDHPDGMLLLENYLGAGITTNGTYHVVLHEDEYFFMGDNRPVSQDARYFGPISGDEIVGRAWLRIWPLDRFEHFTPPTY